MLYFCNHLTSSFANYCKVRHSILNTVHLQWFVLFFFFVSIASFVVFVTVEIILSSE